MGTSNVALRYCGGCNPRYDRVAAVEKLKRRFPELVFRPYTPGEEYGAVLLVCGCTAQCAGQSDLPEDVPRFVMSGSETQEAAETFFEKMEDKEKEK